MAYPPGGDPQEWSVVGHDDVWAGYLSEVRQGKVIVADARLTDVSQVGGRFKTEADAPTLGRILFHLLQEYARHMGQLDVVRELLDGSTGE